MHIPDRDEGYGPSKKAVDDFAIKGCDLLISLDCGTTAFEPLEYAVQKGMDVIVLDHHEAEVKLPKIYALVNPKRLDESNDYPSLKYMAAVGVVFMSAPLPHLERNRLNITRMFITISVLVLLLAFLIYQFKIRYMNRKLFPPILLF